MTCIPKSAYALIVSDNSRNVPLTRRGFLIALDGPAGVGKTTVTALAAARLADAGVSALATRQPSESPLGILARSSTHDLHGLPLTFLMAADRHHHHEHVIAPALAAGQVVICDRYLPTALVLDQMDGADPEFIWGIYQYLPWPDLAIILVGDPATCRARAAARGTYGRFHEGGTATGEAEASLYTSTAALLARSGYPITTVPVGDDSASQVTDALMLLIGGLMGTRTDQQRKRLP